MHTPHRREPRGRAGSQGPAALPHLRLGRRRQVDPDRPAAARHQADLRRPAGGARNAIQRKHGTTGDDIDFALLLDGLEAEREQGITIDVAYRFFATPRRSFIVADTPGHEQYTRNMATGASNADLAVILIDARKGVLAQTRRHSLICSLLGIRHVVLAVNKIDLVGYRPGRLRPHRRRLHGVRRRSSASPRSCRSRSRRATATTSSSAPASTPWYHGPAPARLSGDGRRRATTAPASRSASRCNGSTGRTSISAATPARSPPARSRPATRSWSPASGRTSQVKRDRHLRRRPRQRREAGDAVTLTLDRRDRHRPRRRAGRARRRARRSPTSSPRI